MLCDCVFFKSILEQYNAWKQVQMFNVYWSLRISFMHIWVLFAYSLNLSMLFYSLICNDQESMPRPERLLLLFKKSESDQALKEPLLTQCRLFRIWKDWLWKEIPLFIRNLAIYPCVAFALSDNKCLFLSLMSALWRVSWNYKTEFPISRVTVFFYWFSADCETVHLKRYTVT